MVEKFNEKVNTLAAEYWKLKSTIANKEGEDRLEEIEKLLERGIGGKLKDTLEEEAKRLRRGKEDRNNAFTRLEGVKEEIMELTAELAPNLDIMSDNFFPYDNEHEPISEDYFSTLTDIFFGEPLPVIQFKEATFSKDGIEIHTHGDDSALKILGYVMTIIQETAKKKLGMENKIDKSWRLLKQDEYAFISLELLLKGGRELKIEELKEISHKKDKEYKELVRDVYDKNLVKGMEYLLSDEWEYNLVKGYKGVYEATDFGKWVWTICNAEERRGIEKSIPNSSIHRLLKFLRR
jgi:hypothetical protein